MNAEFTYFASAFVALFVIVDPFGLVPFYLTLTARFNQEDRRIVRRQASLVSLGIMLTFGLVGLSILRFLGITLPAFQIAGGLLLVSLGLAELNVKRDRVNQAEQDESLARENISIFPLGTPLIAGPGAISTVVLYASKADSIVDKVSLIIAILGVSAIVYLCLAGAPVFYRILGRTGLNLITRLMGILITAVAVQFILNGIEEALKAGGFL